MMIPQYLFLSLSLSHSLKLFLNVFLILRLQVLQDVTKDEFIAIMEILKCQKSMTTVQGRQQLVDIVTEQAELDQSFEVWFCQCSFIFINIFSYKKEILFQALYILALMSFDTICT